jgi:hypothetical protein
MAYLTKCLYQGQPTVIPPPAMQVFTTATSGGTLPAGTYYYRVTALLGGVETLPAPETSSITATGTTSIINVNWSTVNGATGYKVYGRTQGAEQLIATIADPTMGTWLDTGAVTPFGAMPTTTTIIEAVTAPGLYRPPTGKTALVKSVIVSNPGLTPAQIYLSRVPAGGAASAVNRMLGGVVVNPDSYGVSGGPLIVPLFIPLGPMDFLAGFTTHPGLVLTITGVEIG